MTLTAFKAIFILLKWRDWGAAMDGAEGFGPGRLSAKWLDAGEEGESPWVLRSNVPDTEGGCDAFIGNGLIGQRIGPEGDGSAYSPGSASWMHGLWGASRTRREALMELPRWATLGWRRLLDTQFRPSRHMLGYLQEMHLDRGVVETRYRQRTGDADDGLRRSTFLCRHLPNVAVLHAEADMKWKGTAGFEDVLDGSFIADGVEWTLRDGETMVLAGTLGPRQRRVAIAPGSPAGAEPGHGGRLSV